MDTSIDNMAGGNNYDERIHQPWPALRETTLLQIETRMAELDEHACADDVLTWLDRATAFQNEAKRLRDALSNLAIAWIKANGPLRIGGDTYLTVGHNRVVKCLDVRQTLHALLRHLGGDVDVVASLLSSDAWKHGACRHTLSAEEFGRLFTTQVRARLVDGRPEERLVLVDPSSPRRR